mmetsp:Transcript_22128/g.69234  ORF Transcript_22128/g.69234 Transcript_22128/m.69234 type:complete len:116 (+) Transcript_22128:390-737(+)
MSTQEPLRLLDHRRLFRRPSTAINAKHSWPRNTLMSQAMHLESPDGPTALAQSEKFSREPALATLSSPSRPHAAQGHGNTSRDDVFSSDEEDACDEVVRPPAAPRPCRMRLLSSF